jgi:hypothetical protein
MMHRDCHPQRQERKGRQRKKRMMRKDERRMDAWRRRMKSLQDVVRFLEVD